MAHPIKDRNEEVDIYGYDPAYQIDISYDFKGLPSEYGDFKDIHWIFRFDLKADKKTHKPQTNKYKIKLLKAVKDVKYVLYKQDGTVEALSPGVERDLIAGDPAVGISH
jgi:hypothetical protein